MGGIRSGDDFFSTSFGTSAFLNSVQDMEAAYREGRLGKPSAASLAGLNSNVVSVKNTSGDDRARGEVVQLATSLIDELSDWVDSPWFEGNAPDEEIGLDIKLGICQGPIPENAIGDVQISGRILARVNVTDILHTHCVAEDGEFVLKSQIGGPIEILSPLEDTGEQDVWVNLCSPKLTLPVVALGTISAGTSSTDYAVLEGPFGSESPSAVTVPPAVNRGRTIDALTVALLVRVGNAWELREGEADSGGSSSDPENVRLFFGVSTGAMRWGDGTLVVDNVEAFDAEPGEPATPTVNNPYHFYCNNDARIAFSESPGRSGDGYTILFAEPVASVIEGYVYQPFTTDDSKFGMMIERAYQGEWPEHAGAQQTVIQVLNIARTVDPHNRGPFLFEGEYGAVVRAELWPEASNDTGASLGTTFVYRVVWVECPEQSPVESSMAQGAAFLGSDLYSSGGQPASMAGAFYYGA